MRHSPSGSSPAVRTAGTLLLILALASGILWWARQGSGTDAAFVDSPGFRFWALVVAASFAVWVRLAVTGWTTARGLAAGRAAWLVARDAVAFVIVVAVAVLLLRVVLRTTRQIPVPVDGYPALALLLLIAAAVAIAPWVISVWLAHERVAALAVQIRQTATGPEVDGGPLVRELLTTWTTVERCVLALAALVSTAVLSSGALRFALVPAVLSAEQFSSTAVLLYGAFFAIVLAVAVLPLVIAWRNTASELVGRVVGDPPRGVPDEQWALRRSRMEALLRLDVGVLRAPLTVLGVLSPLLTAVATAFIPGLG